MVIKLSIIILIINTIGCSEQVTDYYIEDYCSFKTIDSVIKLKPDASLRLFATRNQYKNNLDCRVQLVLEPAEPDQGILIDVKSINLRRFNRFYDTLKMKFNNKIYWWIGADGGSNHNLQSNRKYVVLDGHSPVTIEFSTMSNHFLKRSEKGFHIEFTAFSKTIFQFMQTKPLNDHEEDNDEEEANPDIHDPIPDSTPDPQEHIQHLNCPNSYIRLNLSQDYDVCILREFLCKKLSSKMNTKKMYNDLIIIKTKQNEVKFSDICSGGWWSTKLLFGAIIGLIVVIVTVICLVYCLCKSELRTKFNLKSNNYQSLNNSKDVKYPSLLVKITPRLIPQSKSYGSISGYQKI